MMALIGLILFTAALGAVAHVAALTLWPALPRMAALLAGDNDAAQRQPVAFCSVHLQSSATGRSRSLDRHYPMALAA